MKCGPHRQQAARHAQRQVQPAEIRARHRVVQETPVGGTGRGIGRQQAHGRIGGGDVLPALRIHVAGLHQHGLQQQFHLLRLVQQVIVVVALAVLDVDQLRHFLAVRHRILPAAQAGGAERFHALGMAAQFVLAGKQVVAVEIDAGRARRKLVIGKSRPVQVVRFVGGIRGNRLDLAVDQVLDPVRGRQAPQAGPVDTHFPQEERDFIGSGRHIRRRTEHHGGTGQPVHVRRAAVLAHQQHAGRMLEHDGQHHQRLAGHAAQQETAVAHAILGLSRQHGRFGPLAVAALAQLDVQARVAVIALLDGRVIAGKLELVAKAQLQDDALQRPGRCNPAA